MTKTAEIHLSAGDLVELLNTYAAAGGNEDLRKRIEDVAAKAGGGPIAFVWDGRWA